MKRKLSHIFDKFAGRLGHAAALRRHVLRVLARGETPLAAGAARWLAGNDMPVRYGRRLAAEKLGGKYQRYNDTAEILLSRDFDGYAADMQVNILVHEIRHAWQDDEGLLSGLSVVPIIAREGLLPAFLMLCVEEADAHAHGVAATGLAKNDVYLLQTGFMNWFSDEMPAYLASFSARWEVFMQSVEDMCRARGQTLEEFWHSGALGPSAPPPVRFDRGEGILRLGASFSGENYMQAGDFHRMLPQLLLPAAREAFENCGHGALFAAQAVLQRLTAPLISAARPRKGQA